MPVWFEYVWIRQLIFLHYLKRRTQDSDLGEMSDEVDKGAVCWFPLQDYICTCLVTESH